MLRHAVTCRTSPSAAHGTFRKLGRRIACVLALLLPTAAMAQDTGRGAGAPPSDDGTLALFPELEARRLRLEDSGWLLRAQATFIEQAHPAFASPYRAAGSLQPAALQRNTFSADLILGRRLWEGAEFILDPQVSRGFGLSGTTGAAAFPNGEAFRIGSEDLKGYVPRAFLRQTIALSAETIPAERLDDDPLRFRGPLPVERITLTAGKISVFDIFDDNRYAHDPRTQFQNWAFISAGAYDFAADARGYTNGATAEWENAVWGVRAGAVQVARRINSLSLDPQPGRGHQLLLQADHFHRIADRPGAVRVLGGLSRTRSQTWNELLAGDLTATDVNPRGGYRGKLMLVINAEQELTNSLGVFARLSWNDGRAQEWMFTEMDNAASAGLSLRGTAWGRGADTVGLAANTGGISGAHRRFLAAGGIGFITGDGRLTYGREVAVETYYAAAVAPGLVATADYQLIANPAYNRDRGPVSVFGLRLRAAF